MRNESAHDVALAVFYRRIVSGADAARSNGLFIRAAEGYATAAALAPDRERETALLCRAWECAERAVGRMPTIDGA